MAVAAAASPRCPSHSAISSDQSTTRATSALAMTALTARVGEAVAKLVLLPVVGVSLCGAVTLMLGLQWMEALQRQRQQLQWRAHAWAALLAFVLALLPSKRLGAAVSPCEDKVEGQDGLEKATSMLYCSGKRDEASGGESYEARPLKRQRSEADGRQGAGQEEDQEQQESAENGAAVDTLEGSKVKSRVRRRVFIWDLDETLVLFASLYTGTFAQMHGKEVAPGVALGEQMMTFLLAMLERHFFFSDLHDADVDHIGRVAASSSEEESVDGHLPQRQEQRERYERIREIYERRGHVDFLHDTGSEWFAIRRALVSAIDSFSTGWLHEARQVLELITEPTHRQTTRRATTVQTSDGQDQDSTRDTEESNSNDDDDEEEEEVENVNVLVTNTQLVPALCKCLIYQLDTFFPIDRVYSSAKIHKYRCFETIIAKYEAPGVEFVAIGDGLEEEQVSIALGLEFHKIRSLVDLKRLRYDLQLMRSRSGSDSGSTAAVVSSSATAAMPVASPVGQTAAV